MTAQQALILLLQASIFLTVLGFALRSSLAEATSMLRRPSLLVRAWLAMLVIMPIVVTTLVTEFAHRGSVLIGLVALSVSPVPPMVPRKLVKAGGSREYVAGLLVAMSLIAIVTVPLSVMILNAVFGSHANLGVDRVVKILGLSVLLPAALGIAIRHLLPRSENYAGPVLRIATILLAVGAVVLIVGTWAALRAVVDLRFIVGAVLMAVLGLVVGHLLGGPVEGNRTALAISTASRHPALALAVALSVPEANKQAELGIVLVYLVVASLVCIPYQKWRERAAAVG